EVVVVRGLPARGPLGWEQPLVELRIAGVAHFVVEARVALVIVRAELRVALVVIVAGRSERALEYAHIRKGEFQEVGGAAVADAFEPLGRWHRADLRERGAT